MFCSACGQQNPDDATYCSKCGKQIASLASAQPPSQSTPPAQPVYVNAEPKESGAVIAMSVIGFVFGLIGMMGSFIPCIGSLAFYIGLPAALVSAIALGIAYSQKTKKTFAIVAVTISLIGVVISGWQYFSIVSAGKNAQRQLNQMLNRAAPQIKQNATGTKIMHGTVTKVEFGSHAGNLTVKNAEKEIEFFGNDTMELRGKFPSVGDKVTIYYRETQSRDTPYIIETLVGVGGSNNVSKNSRLSLPKWVCDGLYQTTLTECGSYDMCSEGVDNLSQAGRSWFIHASNKAFFDKRKFNDLCKQVCYSKKIPDRITFGKSQCGEL